MTREMNCLASGTSWQRDSINGLEGTTYSYQCTNAVFGIGNPAQDTYCVFGELVDGVLNKYRTDAASYVISYNAGVLSFTVDQSRPTAHLVIAYS